MRKWLICVPMMTLLLTGCAGGMSGAEELALTIRGEHLASAGCTAVAEVTADYGRRVYTYGMEVQRTEGETVLTVTAPELVAGITARVTGKESRLEFDDLSLDTGPLDGEGLTPVSALPLLLDEITSGYMTGCSLEGDLLRVDCGDPEGTPGQGREVVLWFRLEDHTLIRGEVFWDGTLVIQCLFSQFTLQ